MEFSKILTSFLNLLHLLIKFTLLGIYFFTYLSSAFYKDLRSAILYSGLLLNELFGYLYNKKTESKNNNNNNNNNNNLSGGASDDKEFCKLFDNNKFKLNNSHSEFMSFVSSFYLSDMYYKQKLDVIPFTTVITLLLLTVWS